MSYRPKDAELLVGLWGLVPQPIRGKGRGRTQAPSVGECAGSGREPRPISKTGDPSRVAWNHRQCQTVSLCVYGRSHPPRESTAVNIAVCNAPERVSVWGAELTASTLLGRHASEPVQAWHVRWTQVADALRAVSEARVRREVGVEPEAEVLERLAALPLFHGLDIPGATMAEKGRAVERVLRRIVEAVDAALQPFQEDATPTGSGPDRGLPLPVSGQLAPSPYFTDRHRELGDLDQWLLDQPDHRTNRVMMITGTAGVGKTALARRWLHSLGDRFPDGELCADLRGYGADGPKAPGEILGQFLRVLGVPSERVPGSLDEQTALYRSLMASRRMLVLLDDAVSTTQVRPLLPGSSDTVVVVTSRRRLGGLLAAGAALLPLGPLREPAAVELLARFIGTKRVGAGRAAAAGGAVGGGRVGPGGVRPVVPDAAGGRRAAVPDGRPAARRRLQPGRGRGSRRPADRGGGSAARHAGGRKHARGAGRGQLRPARSAAPARTPPGGGERPSGRAAGRGPPGSRTAPASRPPEPTGTGRARRCCSTTSAWPSTASAASRRRATASSRRSPATVRWVTGRGRPRP